MSAADSLQATEAPEMPRTRKNCILDDASLTLKPDAGPDPSDVR